MGTETVCRGCGCTEDDACWMIVGYRCGDRMGEPVLAGCRWVEEDLCSGCAWPEDRVRGPVRDHRAEAQAADD